MRRARCSADVSFQITSGTGGMMPNDRKGFHLSCTRRRPRAKTGALKCRRHLRGIQLAPARRSTTTTPSARRETTSSRTTGARAQAVYRSALIASGLTTQAGRRSVPNTDPSVHRRSPAKIDGGR